MSNPILSLISQTITKYSDSLKKQTQQRVNEVINDEVGKFKSGVIEEISRARPDLIPDGSATAINKASSQRIKVDEAQIRGFEIKNPDGKGGYLNHDDLWELNTNWKEAAEVVTTGNLANFLKVLSEKAEPVNTLLSSLNKAFEETKDRPNVGRSAKKFIEYSRELGKLFEDLKAIKVNPDNPTIANEEIHLDKLQKLLKNVVFQTTALLASKNESLTSMNDFGIKRESYPETSKAIDSLSTILTAAIQETQKDYFL